MNIGEINSKTVPAIVGDLSLAQEIIRRPKIDIHRHLEGSLRAAWLLPLAARHGIDLPSNDLNTLTRLIEITPDDKDLIDFLKKFPVIGKLFKSRAAIEDITCNVVRDAAQDNVIYLELSLSPIYMAESHNLPHSEVMAGVIDGIKRARTEHEIDVNLILLVERHRDIKIFGRPILSLAEAFRGRHSDVDVVAIGLANDEVNFGPELFVDVFNAVKESGLHISIHAGEAGNPQNILRAIDELGAERLGHGVLAVLAPAVLARLIADRIPFEICPTSNLQTGIVSRLEDHPLPRLFRAGARTTINTDDPGISRITLSSEMAECIARMSLSLEDIDLMQRTAAEVSFLDAARRNRLVARL